MKEHKDSQREVSLVKFPPDSVFLCEKLCDLRGKKFYLKLFFVFLVFR
jgi:hypothetical protein